MAQLRALVGEQAGDYGGAVEVGDSPAAPLLIPGVRPGAPVGTRTY
ncbi:MAG: hypothetical protein LC800_14985 [Acidobacteria bacterium]|nr:hypothetical protein [Acidobacteriota bacterium]